MITHVLLNLFNNLRKIDKTQRLAEHFFHFFCNKFNKFINTGA